MGQRDKWHGDGVFSREHKRGKGGRTHFVQYRYEGRMRDQKDDMRP